MNRLTSLFSACIACSAVCAAALGQCFGDRTMLPAVAPTQYGSIGESAAMEGNLFIVGAPYGSPNSGAAYVYEWDGMNWGPATKLQAPDTTGDDIFGRGVATDGTRCLVYAGQSDTNPRGAAYVYVRQGANWVMQGKLLPPNSDSYLSYQVAIHGDLALIGDPAYSVGQDYGVGVVHLYRRLSGVWQYASTIQSPVHQQYANFGGGIALDATTLVISASGESTGSIEYAGAAYVYNRSGTSVFGPPVRIVSNTPTRDESMGRSLALSGDRIAMGSGGGGTIGPAYVFKRMGGGWIQEARIPSPWSEYSDFGRSIDISNGQLAVGAPDFNGAFPSEGAVATYRLSSSTWVPQVILHHPSPSSFFDFGYSLGLDWGRLCIGTPDDDVQANEGGSALAYRSGSLGVLPLSDAAAQQGGQATFVSSAFGAGPFTYQWYVNDVAVPAGLAPYQGGDTSQLTVNPVLGSMASAIRVDVTDACGFRISSNVVSLNSTPPPASCIGDANGDGMVTFPDITSVLQRFGQVCP